MLVKDETVLDRFRAARQCENCGHWLYARAHPHHIFSRGAGRLDVPINLISLGGYADCNCHGSVHNGKIKRDDLLKIVARREKTTPDAITTEIRRLQRAEKDGTEPKRKGQS